MDSTRENAIKGSLLYSKYANAVDPESAFELLQRMGIEKAQAEQSLKDEAEQAKQREKDNTRMKRAAKSVGTTVAGTVGREVGKNIGKNFGKFGKTLGGNTGAQLFRGLLNTLFKG